MHLLSACVKCVHLGVNRLDPHYNTKEVVKTNINKYLENLNDQQTVNVMDILGPYTS